MTVGRVPRQAPADLTFNLDRDLVESWAGQERAWLGADRRAAFERWQELPVEGNRLYTTYLDLRLAELADATAWPAPAAATPRTVASSTKLSVRSDGDWRAATTFGAAAAVIRANPPSPS